MKGYSAILTILSGLAAAAPATSGSSPGFVSIDIKAETIRTTQDNSFSFYKRDRSFFESTLINKLIFYTAQIGVGTPPQYFPVTIDTGSSDFWIAGSQAIASTYYDGSLSSTYHSNNTKFAIHYVKGSNTGSWATEKVAIGDVSVNDLPFGNVDRGVDLGGTVGVMGIGSMKNEAPVILKTGSMYPNFPRKLKDQGHINKVAYSLFLNTLNATSGTLLFGGVDESRFSGPLYTVPVLNDRSLDVELTSLSMNGSDIASWDSTKVTLDSGTSFTYLPSDAITEIGNKINGVHFIGGLYFIDSSNIDWNQSLEFNFSGAIVSVPLKTLTVKSKDVITPGSKLNPKYDYVIGLLSNVNSKGFNLLGDSFLRAAYIVYDLDDWEVSIAQASYDQDYSNIEPIISSVPFATVAPNIAAKAAKAAKNAQ